MSNNSISKIPTFFQHRVHHWHFSSFLISRCLLQLPEVRSAARHGDRSAGTAAVQRVRQVRQIIQTRLLARKAQEVRMRPAAALRLSLLSLSRQVQNTLAHPHRASTQGQTYARRRERNCVKKMKEEDEEERWWYWRRLRRGENADRPDQIGVTCQYSRGSIVPRRFIWHGLIITVNPVILFNETIEIVLLSQSAIFTFCTVIEFLYPNVYR